MVAGGRRGRRVGKEKRARRRKEVEREEVARLQRRDRWVEEGERMEELGIGK